MSAATRGVRSFLNPNSTQLLTQKIRIGRGPFQCALVLEEPDPTLDVQLRSLGIEPYRPDDVPDEAGLIKLLEERPYELIYKRSRVPITAKVLDAAPSLFAVNLCCIGDDSVDKQACADRGVLVTNDPISNGRSVVELFLGTMICMSRRIFEAVRETDNNEWFKTQKGRFEVRGKILGVFGLGNIGKQVAQVAEGLGMRVVFFDNRELAREVGETMGWSSVDSLEELFRVSDIVTAHVSAFDYRGRANDNVIRYEDFAAFGEKEHESPRVFVNLARGNIFDPADLLRAADEGHVGQAMVDVYPEEPKSSNDAWNNPYAGHPRIFGTPHIGAATLEAQPRIAAHVAGTTRLLSRNGRLRNCVFGGRHEVGIGASDDIGSYLTVVHSCERGTKKAVDDAIYNAGANNITSSHRDFVKFGIAYEVVGVDKALSDSEVEGLILEARELTGNPDAIRAIRQIPSI